MHRKDVPIHSPCGADFAKMSATELRERFCRACETTVHDLSGRSDAEIQQLLEAGPACVRYVYDRSGKILDRVPEGATLVPARSLMSKLQKSRWLVAAALATTTVVFEACGGNSGGRYDNAILDDGTQDDDPAGNDGIERARSPATVSDGRDATVDAPELGAGADGDAGDGG